MQVFKYKAKDNRGKTVNGLVEAADSLAAAATLREHGLLIISIAAKGADISVAGGLKRFSGVGGGERALFTRLLATMLTAGLPLTDALVNLQTQTGNAKLREVIKNMVRDIEGGISLSAAMSKNGEVFPEVYISLVKSGEASGKLDKSLERMADTLEKEQEFKGKVKGAMIYPIIVVLMMALISVTMMIVVIPKISDVYKQFGADLPLPTKILIGMSDFLSNYLLFLGLGIVGLFFLFQYVRKTNKAFDYAFSNLAFKFPIFGKLNQEVTLGLMSRVLGALVESGISILDGMKIVAETMGNNQYRYSLGKASKDVEKGFSLSQSLRVHSIYPSIMFQMIAIGEETGTLDQSLNRLAWFFETNAERKVKALTTALEPVLILFMGMGVAGLAIAILLPMFNLVNVIK